MSMFLCVCLWVRFFKHFPWSDLIAKHTYEFFMTWRMIYIHTLKLIRAKKIFHVKFLYNKIIVILNRCPSKLLSFRTLVIPNIYHSEHLSFQTLVIPNTCHSEHEPCLCLLGQTLERAWGGILKASAYKND